MPSSIGGYRRGCQDVRSLWRYGAGCSYYGMAIIQTMRINLVTPFTEKDAVKALGARWDGVKKLWYITDVADLTPFMRWIPNLEAATDASGGNAMQKTPPKLHPRESRGIITVPMVEVPSCACHVHPWEPCEHSAA
jgi:hypothetical protein